MKDGTPTILYTKETREYARHVRYWRDVRGSQVSLFSCLSRMYHVTRVCATSGECQGQPVFVHVKRVTLRVITQYDIELTTYGPETVCMHECAHSITNCKSTYRPVIH
jgi:hypothetical protein